MTHFGKIIILIIIFTGSINSFDLTNIERGKIKYFFNPSDISFVKSLSIDIEPNFEELKKKLNHTLKNKIKIFLPDSEEEFEKLTGGRLPEWSGAVAISKNRIIIIKPQNFKDKNKLIITIKHELIHIILADKLNDHKLPLWLNEGLATYLSDYSVDWNEGLVISNAIAANKILELNDINQLMKLNTASANLAYLEAKIAAEYLINQIGISKLPEFLDDLNKYDNIDFVFEKYLGYDLIDFEYYWYNYLKDKYQWMVVLNFDNLIWLMLIFVVIIAYIVVKMRNYKKIQMWKSDELEEYTED